MWQQVNRRSVKSEIQDAEMEKIQRSLGLVLPSRQRESVVVYLFGLVTIILLVL